MPADPGTPKLKIELAYHLCRAGSAGARSAARLALSVYRNERDGLLEFARIESKRTRPPAGIEADARKNAAGYDALLLHTLAYAHAVLGERDTAVTYAKELSRLYPGTPYETGTSNLLGLEAP